MLASMMQGKGEGGKGGRGGEKQEGGLAISQIAWHSGEEVWEGHRCQIWPGRSSTCFLLKMEEPVGGSGHFGVNPA